MVFAQENKQFKFTLRPCNGRNLEKERIENSKTKKDGHFQKPIKIDDIENSKTKKNKKKDGVPADQRKIFASILLQDPKKVKRTSDLWLNSNVFYNINHVCKFFLDFRLFLQHTGRKYRILYNIFNWPFRKWFTKRKVWINLPKTWCSY